MDMSPEISAATAATAALISSSSSMRCRRSRVRICSSIAESFGEFWKDALSVLMARERARIGLAASEGDLSRRIVAYAYDDQEDSAADT